MTSPQTQYGWAILSAPTLIVLSPSQGTAVGGNTVTIVGSGFTGASAVKFGTTAASSFTVVSDST
ncbi:IPT/TIG domain-containing protein, partial [Kitasatospora sp. NPDC050543]|uniref:IPT/TIG domain-containing protein n=1 Tax=Kitasatospora sp. NPDC050543 TaxID=3364054 RepID=UPI0037AB2BDF